MQPQPFQDGLGDSFFGRKNCAFPPNLPLSQNIQYPPFVPTATASMGNDFVEHISGGDARAMRLEGVADALLQTNKKIANLQLEMRLKACEQNPRPPMAIMCENTNTNSIHRQQITHKAPDKQETIWKEQATLKRPAVMSYPRISDPLLEVEEPRHVDILLGETSRSQTHIGNVAFRALVDSKLDMYIRAPRQEAKIDIGIEITNSIYAAGGRFFMPHDQKWKEVDVGLEKMVTVIRDRLHLKFNPYTVLRVHPTKNQATPKFPESANFADIVDYFVRDTQDQVMTLSNETHDNSQNDTITATDRANEREAIFIRLQTHMMTATGRLNNTQNEREHIFTRLQQRAISAADETIHKQNHAIAETDRMKHRQQIQANMMMVRSHQNYAMHQAREMAKHHDATTSATETIYRQNHEIASSGRLNHRQNLAITATDETTEKQKQAISDETIHKQNHAIAETGRMKHRQIQTNRMRVRSHQNYAMHQAREMAKHHDATTSATAETIYKQNHTIASSGRLNHSQNDAITPTAETIYRQNPVITATDETTENVSTTSPSSGPMMKPSVSNITSKKQQVRWAKRQNTQFRLMRKKGIVLSALTTPGSARPAKHDNNKIIATKKQNKEE